MSQFNAIGEYGLNDVLTKRLTTPGGANAPSVAPEIFPVLCLENDRPEWIHLANGGLYSRRVVLSAVAGQFGMLQLYVPSDRRTIAILELARLTTTGSPVVLARGVGISAGLGGWVGVTTGARDFRARQEGSGALLESNTNAAPPTLYAQLDRLASANEACTLPIIITPGTSLVIWGTTVNAALDITLAWRERTAQPGELA